MRFLPTTLKTTAALSIAALGLTAAAGCDAGETTVDPVEPTVTTPGVDVDGPLENAAENTGAAIDNTVDRTGTAIDNAANRTGAAVNDAATTTDNAMNRTGAATDNAITDIQAGAGTTTRPMAN